MNKANQNFSQAMGIVAILYWLSACVTTAYGLVVLSLVFGIMAIIFTGLWFFMN